MLKRLTLLMAAGAVFYSAYPVALTINENTRYQEIDGFGFAEGAKDGSWNSAPSNVCPQWWIDTLVHDLGMSINRHMLDETASPNSSVQFDVSLIPQYKRMFLKRMVQSGKVKLVFSVWSPPCWMKGDGQCESVEGFCADPGNVLPSSNYNAYAQFLIRYLQFIKDTTGSDLYGLSLQNEPYFDEPYVSCHYCNGTYMDMFKTVGGQVKAAHANTKLYGPEHMGSYDGNSEFFDGLLRNDATARGLLDVFAVHSYTDGVTPDFGGAAAVVGAGGAPAAYGIDGRRAGNGAATGLRLYKVEGPDGVAVRPRASVR